MRVKIDNGGFVPQRAHETDAGYDLRSPIAANIMPYGSVVIDTRVHVELPPGKCAIIVSKSGLYMHHDIISTGLIDEGFTGSIKIKMCNLGDYEYHVRKGDKIGQFMITNYYKENVEIVEELPQTERGDGGYGSTGK